MVAPVALLGAGNTQTSKKKSVREILHAYYRLAKPGMVYGNLLPPIGAYLFASRWNIDPWTAFAMVVGLGLVIASACTFNNCIDRDIDQKMERTKSRALAAGVISPRAAIVYGAVLGIVGFALVLCVVNAWAALAALVGFVMYVFAYTFSKRTTKWATEIGSISGAAPIVAGYAAAAGRFDAAALILFLILALWQMPHFYAIAIMRAKDYAAAKIPVLPLSEGVRAAKLRSVFYIVAFAFASVSLAVFGYAGYVYAAFMTTVGLAWLSIAARGLRAPEDPTWARRFFFSSLFVLVAFSVVLAFIPLLP